MKVSRRAFLAGASAVIIGTASRAGAAEQRQLVRMAYFDDYEPFSALTADRRMTGLLVDAAELVLHRAGFRVSHHGFPWARAQAMVKAGKLDAMCTNPTINRQKYTLFCDQPVIRASIGMYHRRDDDRFADLSDREAARRFVLGDFVGNDWAKQHLSDFRIAWSNTEEQVFRSLKAGRVDAFVHHEPTALAKLRALGMLDEFTYTPTPFLGSFAFTMGLRRTWPDVHRVIEEMNTITEQMRQHGELDQIMAPYLA